MTTIIRPADTHQATSPANAVSDNAYGELIVEAAAVGEDIDRCLEFARRWGERLPLPGSGATQRRWHMLASAAAGDLTAARVLEPHADALAILAEAGVDAMPGAWGVFAAEAPGAKLSATPTGDGFELSGTKPWCSLGGRLDRALVTAHTAGGRRLFAIDLRHDRVRARPGAWLARGLRAVDSGPIDFDRVPAQPVGEDQWYLTRAGFAWGGMGVAACWLGGAAALVDTLQRKLAERDFDPVRSLNLGEADTARFAASSALSSAAVAVDSGASAGDAGALLAARVRAVVHSACEHILRHVGHALGPAPLAFDEAYARRVADLEIYLRQHHGERDMADLGRLLVQRATP